MAYLKNKTHELRLLDIHWCNVVVVLKWWCNIKNKTNYSMASSGGDLSPNKKLVSATVDNKTSCNLKKAHYVLITTVFNHFKIYVWMYIIVRFA